MSGYTRALTDGAAALLADSGVGVYRPDGVYDPGELGIFVGVLPDTPDRALCLTPYTVEDTAQPDTVTGLQVRGRAGRDPRDVDNLMDAVRDVLHMREHYVIGGIDINLSWRQSQGQLGRDSNERLEIAANYYLRTIRPAPHLDQ